VGSIKASRLLAALFRCGWTCVCNRGAHKKLVKAGYANYTFSFHDREEIGPRMLAKISKQTGLRKEDL